jgi:hypothetical protein
MNVDTCTFAAISAESAMLRKHAERAAPGRHRRQRKPGTPQRRERPLDGFWRGGYVTAMTEIFDLIGAELDRTGGDCAQVVRSVTQVAYAANELYHAEGFPQAWAEGQDA